MWPAEGAARTQGDWEREERYGMQEIVSGQRVLGFAHF